MNYLIFAFSSLLWTLSSAAPARTEVALQFGFDRMNLTPPDGNWTRLDDFIRDSVISGISQVQKLIDSMQFKLYVSHGFDKPMSNESQLGDGKNGNKSDVGDNKDLNVGYEDTTHVEVVVIEAKNLTSGQLEMEEVEKVENLKDQLKDVRYYLAPGNICDKNSDAVLTPKPEVDIK